MPFRPTADEMAFSDEKKEVNTFFAYEESDLGRMLYKPVSGDLWVRNFHTTL